ncbi:hypothetical protein D3C80_2092510 [compost metagenome]
MQLFSPEQDGKSFWIMKNSTYEIGTQETYDYARYEIKEGVIREIYLHHDIP